MEDDTWTEGSDSVGLQASGADRGKRLDAALAAHGAVADLSRSRIAALIKAGRLTVDDVPETNPARKLKGGECIVLIIPELEDATPQPEAIPLSILFEDEALIVLDKPAGLVVHPGAGNATGTLVNALLHHCGDSLSGIGGVRRPGLVHRLDKDTSGVMVVAKTDAAHRHLSAQFADHGRTNALERVYTAFVWGGVRPAFTIDAPIGRDRTNRLRMAVSAGSDARDAVTHVARLETYGDPARPAASLVECRLETGRTHQIRVHMAHAGHGLVGDPEYGRGGRTMAARMGEPGQGALLAFPRQALQARALQFTHPETGEVLRFAVDLDADLAALRDALTST